MDRKCRHCTSSMKYSAWILPLLFCLPFVNSLPRSGPNMDSVFYILSLNQQLPTLSRFSASLVLHGSWWARLPFKEQPSPWDPQTLFVVVKVPFHTFLITPESLDTNAMQDTLLILSYPLLSLHIEFFFLDTMLYVLQIVSYSNRWDVFCSPPQPTWWETETQGG